jgi:hypothetical protein
MEPKPYLMPQDSLMAQSVKTKTACHELSQSFIPCNGLDQVNGSPDKKLMGILSDKEYEFKPERLMLLYKFSVHPRETVRNWAEEALYTFTNDAVRLPVLDNDDLSIVFPWRKNHYFNFTARRALLLSRHELITAELANFLVDFRHESISAKLINHILNNIPDSENPNLGDVLDDLLRQITTTHLPNARRAIAKSKALNWRVLDELLENGLPLHSLDAISHVDWDHYSKHADKKQRDDLIKKINRFAKQAPAVARIIQAWDLK